MRRGHPLPLPRFSRARVARCLSVLSVGFVLLGSGCAHPSPPEAPPVAVGTEVPALPTVTGPLPVTPASHPFLASAEAATPIDLGRHGYVEKEFLVSGQAAVYSWSNLTTLMAQSHGRYTTRILVRTPADPARFSGNVRVEPLNPTSKHDLDVEWEIGHDGFMRAGDAYVGITVKPVTIKALKKFDATRYGSLSMANPAPSDQRCDPQSRSSSRHSEDGLAWDIISQVGALIRSDSAANPLHGLPVVTSTLTGWSQSASYDITYLNAIARHVTLPGGRPIFDAYLPGAGSYAGTPINQCALEIPPGDPRVRFNPPARIPVMVVSTPTDFYSAASTPRRADRPEDSDTPERRIRLYEIGGGCHLPADHGHFFPSADELARAGFPAVNWADRPLSTFPLHVVLDSAFANLDRWVRDGVPPPHVSRLTPENTDTWPVRAARDEFGNPVGGVRTPAVDVPIATYVERGFNAWHDPDSPYAGYDIAFSSDRLRLLYPTHQDYVDKVTSDVQRLQAQRWLTDYDAAALITQARVANVP